jgi:predicted transcriptional regulator
LRTEPDFNETYLDGQIAFVEGVREWKAPDGYIFRDIQRGDQINEVEADALNWIRFNLLKDRLSGWMDRHADATEQQIRAKYEELVRLNFEDLQREEGAEVVSFPNIRGNADQLSGGGARTLHEVLALLQSPVDPTLRISRLRSANTTPTLIAPNQTVKEALTLMLLNDFSQLPVMTTPREVKGIITWESIATRIALSIACSQVKDCMDQACIVASDASIFEAIEQIVRHNYVLVRHARTSLICGIVTASDLSVEFRQMSEPFLLLGERESAARTHYERRVYRGRA